MKHLKALDLIGDIYMDTLLDNAIPILPYPGTYHPKSLQQPSKTGRSKKERNKIKQAKQSRKKE